MPPCSFSGQLQFGETFDLHINIELACSREKTTHSAYMTSTNRF